MNKEKLIIQISTGGYLEHKVTYEEIYKTLKPLLGRIPVSGVIIGWSCDRALYSKVLELLKEKGVRCYLWLPVFSETGLLGENIGRLLDSRGMEVKAYGLSEGENFEFYCPNQRRNSTAFLEIYEKYFDGLPFDGVFLDKIRYGTFANGLEGVFSCFCPECMAVYEQLGIDTENLKAEMEKVRLGQGIYAKHPLGISGYERGVYTFENPIWESFFRKKAQDIERALQPITAYFHSKNMVVGMDTFAPFLGYFAGQDMKRLAMMADFIKPMMYRITAAPAGLPFETDCLLRELLRGSQESIEGKRTSAVEHFLRTIGSEGLLQGKFDLAFVRKELAFMTELSLPVYCGIEINKNQVAPVNPDYIRENLHGLKTVPAQGYVLSWDILSAPEENLQTVADYFGEGG